VVRAYDGARVVVDPDRLLPTPSDATLDAWWARVASATDGIGLQVSSVQALHPALWVRARRFLDELHREVGIPAGRADLDLFVGDYRGSPFGLHKDAQDVFTFGVRGAKSFDVWPFDAFADVPGVGAGDRLRGVNLWEVEGALPESERFEVRPDDAVLYFPAESWHRATTDGSLVATLALGVVVRDDPWAHAAAALDRLRSSAGQRPRVWRPGTRPADVTADTRRALGEPAFARALEDEVLRWSTLGGFARAPARRDVVLSLHDRVRLVPGALAWRSGECGIWAAGTLLDWPASVDGQRLVDGLSDGAWHRTGDLCGRRRPGALEMIGSLVAHHALEVEPASAV